MAGPYRYVIGPVVEHAAGVMSYYGAPESCVSWIDLRGLPKMSALGQAGCGLFAMPSGWAVPSEYHWLGGGEGDLRSLYFLVGDQAAWQNLIGPTITRDASTTLADALAEQMTDAADPTGQQWNYPVIPASVPQASTPEAEIVLAGHSRIRRLPFLGLGVGRWGSHVRDVERAKIMEAKQAARGRDPDLWRRQWGDLDRKYNGKVGSDRADDLLSPAMRGFGRTARPLQPKTEYTDDFNRANASTLGGSWTSFMSGSGEIGIASNAAYFGKASTFGAGVPESVRYDSDVSSSDHYCQMTAVSFTGVGSGSDQYGPCARFSGSAETCYRYAIACNTVSGRTLDKIVSGTRTQLSGLSGTNANGDVLKCHCNGSTIGGYRNGSLDGSVTDTAITSGTRGGASYISATFGNKPTGDDWSIADLVAAANNNNLLLLGVG